MTTTNELEEQAMMSTDLLNATSELAMIRRARKEVEDELKQAKEMEEEVEQRILHYMNIQGLEAFRNGNMQITKRIKNTPRLDNYEELLNFIIAETAYDLLQKRLSTVAVRERWENGVVVPGVSCFVEEDIAIREVRK